MKKYKLESRNVLERHAKLVYQNHGAPIDFIDGSLIDNVMYATKRGYLAFIETYVNPNMSTYTVYFSTDINEIYTIWPES